MGAFRFRTLGSVVLERELDGSQVAGSQRRKLAVLAFLALSKRPVTRDTLVEMFWGDEEELRARHSLSNTLSFLRSFLGASSIAARKSSLALTPGIPLRVDALDLLAAAKAGDHDAVVECYGGPFLDGVLVRDSSSFESWVSGERLRMEALFTQSCAAVCTAAAEARAWERCHTVARRWLDADPLAPEPALHLLNATRAGRTPAHRRAALVEYERLAARLAHEFESVPHAQVAELARRIAEQVQADDEAVARAVVSADPVAESSVAEPVAGRASTLTHGGAVIQLRARRRWLVAAGVLALAMGVAAVHRTETRLVEHRRPLIAITDIANVRGDTASAWLEDGFIQLIGSGLSRSAAVEIITPDRLRDTRRRGELAPSGGLDVKTAIDVAHRLGASLAVRGGFTRGNGGFVLDLTVTDVTTLHQAGALTLRGADPAALADQAAAQILQWSVAGEMQPHYAGVETPNVAATQHFVRSLQARSEGHFQDATRELDGAIALDSAFASALVERASAARDDGDTAMVSRLARALRRARFGSWDISRAALDSATHNGEHVRSERLARDLVHQFPHDPRAYSLLAAIYAARGEWGAFDNTTQQQLALDSLANESGRGPCVPCAAYRGLVDSRLTQGDLAGAERAARRWIALQPELPSAWANLAEVLSDSRRDDAALDAERRALLLSGHDATYVLRLARLMIVAGQLEAADSLAQSLNAVDVEQRGGVVDIHVLVLREQGRYRESIRVTNAYHRAHPRDDALLYEELDALGRVGAPGAVRRFFSTEVVSAADTRAMQSTPHGDAARWFTWSRALEANALATSGADTTRLRAIGDSMRFLGPMSYYARDWRLHHHVLGLIAMRAGQAAVAEREFRDARWGVAGWTATVAWLARAQLAQHRGRDAIATLRQGYQAPLDAMGRYVPRSELDYMMSRSFHEAGMSDSAAVYASRVRRAWQQADPEVRRLLDAL